MSSEHNAPGHTPDPPGPAPGPPVGERSRSPGRGARGRPHPYPRLPASLRRAAAGADQAGTDADGGGNMR
jgi:hypothetical protein